MPYTLPASAAIDARKAGASGVNLRDAPARAGRLVATMPNNTPVAVVGVARDEFNPNATALWYQVRFRQAIGFCGAEYITLDAEPIVPLPLAATVDPRKTGGVGLNLRESPSPTGRRLATMRANAPVQIVGAAREGFAPDAALWYVVLFGAQRGYCLGDFVVTASTPVVGLTPQPGSGPFVGAWPVIYPERVATAQFDQLRSYGRHEGIDLRAPDGAPVVAWADGQVATAWNWDGVSKTGNHAYGNHLKLFHPALGLFSMYCHLQSFSVVKDQVVHIGDPIGLAGNTGNSTAPHLHFMLIDPNKGLNGYVYPKVIDPAPHLPKPYTAL